MKQIWNKISTFILYLLSNIVIPLIISVLFLGVIDFSTLTINSNTDILSALTKIRANNSALNLVGSLNNAIIMLIMSFLEISLCVEIFKNINLTNVKLDLNHKVHDFYNENKKVSTVNVTNLMYLRI